MLRAVWCVSEIICSLSYDNWRSEIIFFTDRLTYRLDQIEIAKNYGMAEWHEDLKLCLMQAGVDDKSVVFLFNDTQVSGAVDFVNSRTLSF